MRKNVGPLLRRTLLALQFSHVLFPDNFANETARNLRNAGCSVTTLRFREIHLSLSLPLFLYIYSIPRGARTTILQLNRKNYSRDTRVTTYVSPGARPWHSSYRVGVGSVAIVFGSSAKTVVAPRRESFFLPCFHIFFSSLIYRR